MALDGDDHLDIAHTHGLLDGAQVGEIVRVEAPTDPEREWVALVWGDWGRFEARTRFAALDLVAQAYAR